MTFGELVNYVQSRSPLLAIRDNGEMYTIYGETRQRPFTHDYIHNLKSSDMGKLNNAIMELHAYEEANKEGGIVADCRDCTGLLVLVDGVVFAHYNVSGDCIPF